MKDKGLSIFLKLLFGTGGIMALIAACTEPMALAERIIAASVGFVGLSFALSPVVSLIAGSLKTRGVKNGPEFDQ